MDGFMDIHSIPRSHFLTIVATIVALGSLIITMAAGLGRAAINFRAALSEKPDIAIYLLLPKEEMGKTTLLRGNDQERDYLAETKDGPKLVKLKKGQEQWYVADVEKLHELK